MLGLHDYFLYLCTRKHEDASTSKGCGSAKAKRACFRIRLALYLLRDHKAGSDGPMRIVAKHLKPFKTLSLWQ